MPRKLLALRPVSDGSKDLTLDPGPQEVRIRDIRLRADGDTRDLSAPHVVALAESIAVLGLLEPIVIDRRGHLLAGAHRLAALQLLDIADSDARSTHFYSRIDTSEEAEKTPGCRDLADRVQALDIHRRDACPATTTPVLVVDVKGNDDASDRRRLAVEVAENNVRRPYTVPEIKALAARLKAAGYKVDPGRRKKGAPPTVKSVLEAAIGRSQRTIERILSKQTGGKTKWENARQTFFRVARRLQAEGKDQRKQADRRLLEAVAKILKLEDEDGLG